MQQSGQKRGQVGLADASAKEIRRRRQPAERVGEDVHQRALRVRPPVGQDALEMVPDSFVGVQFRSVRGKRHQLQTARACQELLHRVSPVDVAVVQQDDQMPAEVAQEMAQEDGHFFALDGVLVEVAVQGTMEPLGTDGDAGDGGDSIVTLAVPDDGRLADGTPGLADRRD